MGNAGGKGGDGVGGGARLESGIDGIGKVGGETGVDAGRAIPGTGGQIPGAGDGGLLNKRSDVGGVFE